MTVLHACKDNRYNQEFANASLGGKPIPTLTAQEARQQPTSTDAVMAVMKEHNVAMPVSQVDAGRYYG